LQQSAADAAARQEVADAAARREAAQDAQPAAAIPPAASLSPAAIAVTPEIQPSFRKPDSNLTLSASPTLPYDSPDMQTDRSPAPFDPQVSYTNADSAAFAALNAQTLDFGDAAPASPSKDESAAQPDFLAAPAISSAEEANKRCLQLSKEIDLQFKKHPSWAQAVHHCKLSILRQQAPLHDAIIRACFVFCCLGVCRVCLTGCAQY